MRSSEERLLWFREARFGLFIHWGPYSVAGVEASWPIMAPELSTLAFGNHTPMYGPLQELPLGRTTASDRFVQLHVYDWPKESRIVLEGFPGTVYAISLLTTGEPIPFDCPGSNLIIRVLTRVPDAVNSVLAIQTST
jgi:hypothetical protein